MKNNYIEEIHNHKLASYLAGLIEGDGCIYTTKEGVKPRIIITLSFSKKDLPLAEKLKETFNMGNIQEKRGEECVIWAIYQLEDILFLLTFCNGYFRTGKIVALLKALEHFKKYYNIDIPLKPLDFSDILSNNWLSGFSDADGSFFIPLSKDKISPRTINCTPYFAIEVAENYCKEVSEELGGRSNMRFMNAIASAFNAKIYHSKREAKENRKETSSIRFRISKADNIPILIQYFELSPLFSSKYLNYMDWKKCIEMKLDAKKNGLLIFDIYTKLKKIKNEMNSKRTLFNWKHLDNFYQLSPNTVKSPTIVKVRQKHFFIDDFSFDS